MAATYWQPQSNHLTAQQLLTLAVPALVKPQQSQFLPLWQKRMLALVVANPLAAALVRGQMAADEQTSDQWLNLEDEELPVTVVASSITESDAAMDLMARIDWDKPGAQVEPPTQTLAEIKAVLDL